MATVTYIGTAGDGRLDTLANWDTGAVPELTDDVVFAANATYHAYEGPMTINFKTLDMRGYEVWLRSDYTTNMSASGLITVNATSSLNLFGSVATVLGIRSGSGDATLKFHLTENSCILTSSNLAIDSWSHTINSTTYHLMGSITTNPIITIYGDLNSGFVNNITTNVNLTVLGNTIGFQNEQTYLFIGGEVLLDGNFTIYNNLNALESGCILTINGTTTIGSCGTLFYGGIVNVNLFTCGNVGTITSNAAELSILGSFTVGNVTGTAFAGGVLDSTNSHVIIGTVGGILFSGVPTAACLSIQTGSIGGNFANGFSEVSVSLYIVTGNIATADSAIIGSSHIACGTYFRCGGISQFLVSGGTSSIVAGEYIEIGYVGFALKGAGLPSIDSPFMYLGSVKNRIGPYPFTTRHIGPYRKWATYVSNTPVNYIDNFPLSDTTTLPLPAAGQRMGVYPVSATSIGPYPLA